MQDLPEFNINFVKLIEQHPCLYNNTDEDYYRTYIQDKSWEAIARSIGNNVSVRDCKSRWRNLRGRFTKHLKSTTSTVPTECSKRPYYLAEHLSFLLPFTKSKRPHQENDASDIDDSVSRFLEIDSSVSDHIVAGDELDPVEEIEFKYQPIETDRSDRFDPCPENSDSNKRGSSIHSPQMRGKHRRMDVSEQYIEHNRAHQMHTTIDYSDSDVLFLMSLLPDLKQMDDYQKRKYKIGILRLGGEVLNEFPTTSHAISYKRKSRQNSTSSYMSPDSGVLRTHQVNTKTAQNVDSNEN